MPKMDTVPALGGIAFFGETQTKGQRNVLMGAAEKHRGGT